jgi:hypothetical protein
MTSYTLRKGNTQILIRISKESAEKVTRVGGNTSTSREAMTPLEANREVNRLLRQGYVREQPGKGPKKPA